MAVHFMSVPQTTRHQILGGIMSWERYARK